MDEIVELCLVHEQIVSQCKAIEVDVAKPSISQTVNKRHVRNQDANQCTRCVIPSHLSNTKECLGRSLITSLDEFVLDLEINTEPLR